MRVLFAGDRERRALNAALGGLAEFLAACAHPEARKQDLRDLLQRVHPSLSFELARNRDGRHARLSALDDAALRPLVRYLVEASETPPGVTLSAHLAPASHERSLIRCRRATGVDLSRARARSGFSRGHLLEVVCYSAAAGSAQDERLLDAAQTYVDARLGELCSQDWVGDVRVAPLVGGGPLRLADESDSWKNSYPLAELGAAVEAAVAGVHAGLDRHPAQPALVSSQASWVVFELEAPVQHEYAEQDDLCFASSCVPELYKCFLSGLPFSSQRFSACGETFAYLKYEDLAAAGTERILRRDRVEQLVSRALAVCHAGAVVGAGLGVRYSYIILALRDLAAARQVVEALADAGLGERAWLLFCDSWLRHEWLGVSLASAPPPS